MLTSTRLASDWAWVFRKLAVSRYFVVSGGLVFLERNLVTRLRSRHKRLVRSRASSSSPLYDASSAACADNAPFAAPDSAACGASPLDLLGLGHIISPLPEGSVWAVGGIGRFQLGANLMAIAAGGHVRTGIEDNPYFDLSRTQHGTTAQLVDRVRKLGELAGRTIATPAVTRASSSLAQSAAAFWYDSTATKRHRARLGPPRRDYRLSRRNRRPSPPRITTSRS